MKKKRALFITIIDDRVGFGHYKRSHILAFEALKFDWEIDFLVITNINDLKKIIDKRFTYFFQGSNIIEALNLFIKYNLLEKYDITISDIVYIDLFKEYKKVKDIFKIISHLGILNCSIDALGESSLYQKSIYNKIDILIIPYLTNVQYGKPKFTKIISGNKFIILSNEYTNSEKKIIVDYPKKILITCGGSDIKNLTTEILKLLNTIQHNLIIEVIIGPLFSKDNFENIRKIVDHSPHIIRIIKNQNSLFERLVWSDITISASGLTKYEIAATGTPALLFSIDEENHQINKIFSKYNCFLDLGKGINEDVFITKFEKIFECKELRSSLSNNSRKLIDGMGCFRILNILNSEIL